MADFDKKYNIVDEKTPRHTLMSAHYKQSFAFYTLKERLPIILTQVVDNLSRDKDEIANIYGEEAREELKEILGQISKLKYELQTDKVMTPFNRNETDKDIWNAFLNNLPSNSNSFFTTCWLYAECYMYRRLKSIFESTKIFKDFDYFRKQKENALTCWTDTLESVVKSIENHKHDGNMRNFFRHLLKLNLWGNRCDLSISEGKEIKQAGDPFTAVDYLDEYVLIDQTSDIWDCVSSFKDNNTIIDFVNDNAGYELFTDLLIADFLISKNYASKIRFYVKAIPWFISDVTPHDFHWTLQYLSNHKSDILKNIGQKWNNYINDGKFELSEAYHFWTGPFEYYRMSEVCETLYKRLSEAKLIIFKGDLNYRKLIGDFTWDFTEDFKVCLRGFCPTNLCTLRTVKADLICGLPHGVAEVLDEKDPTWMTTGEYGVIQFVNKD